MGALTKVLGGIEDFQDRRKAGQGRAASLGGAMSAGGGMGEPDATDPVGDYAKQRGGTGRDDGSGMIGAVDRITKRLGKRRD